MSLRPDALDVVWDVPFMSGTTLGGRCSEYRGSTVNPNTCLNLTRRQFVLSTNPAANRNRTTQTQQVEQPRADPWAPAPGPRQEGTIFRMEGGRVQILSNPNRQQPSPRINGSPAPQSDRASPASNRFGSNTPPVQSVNGRSSTPNAPSPRGGHALPPRGSRGGAAHRGGQFTPRGGSPVVAAQGALNHLLPTPPNQGQRGGRGGFGGRGGRGGPRGRGRGGPQAHGQNPPTPDLSS